MWLSWALGLPCMKEDGNACLLLPWRESWEALLPGGVTMIELAVVLLLLALGGIGYWATRKPN